MRERFPSSFHAKVTRTEQGNFAGNPSEDDRMEGGLTGGQQFLRSRMIFAKPRVFLLMYAGAQSTDPDTPAVNQFFDSLKIRSDVDLAGVHEPVKIPEPHFPQPHFPETHLPDSQLTAPPPMRG